MSKKITNCTVCGQPIEYTTKKPLRCSHCKDIKLSTKPMPPKTKWKKETAMIRAMSELFPDVEYIVNGYYSWLLSPKGKPLQLDWYCPELQIAVEFNGQQHYEYTKYFQRTKKAFKYLQACDSAKATACKAKGVTLLSIPYSDKVTAESMAKALKKENPKLYSALLKSGKMSIEQE